MSAQTMPALYRASSQKNSRFGSVPWDVLAAAGEWVEWGSTSSPQPQGTF